MSNIRSKPLSMTELEAVALQRMSNFTRLPYGRLSERAHIAIVHNLSKDYRAEVGITTFSPSEPVESLSMDTVYELWNMGREAVRSLLERYNGATENIQLLATIIFDIDSPFRKMWLSSPTVDKTIECTLSIVNNKRVTESKIIPGRQFSFPVESGFKLELSTINRQEVIRCN